MDIKFTLSYQPNSCYKNNNNWLIAVLGTSNVSMIIIMLIKVILSQKETKLPIRQGRAQLRGTSSGRSCYLQWPFFYLSFGHHGMLYSSGSPILSPYWKHHCQTISSETKMISLEWKRTWVNLGLAFISLYPYRQRTLPGMKPVSERPRYSDPWTSGCPFGALPVAACQNISRR